MCVFVCVGGGGGGGGGGGREEGSKARARGMLYGVKKNDKNSNYLQTHQLPS